jgi:pimeloyl-ACP methyl ester carboxylesterase
VTAAPNPSRGISHDSAYVASFMKQVGRPVLAVGHSYGGAVISTAATGLGNVVGLVFVAAFATEFAIDPRSFTTRSPPTCRRSRPP